MLRKERGITLIALVITIIVLLILAGVTIAMVVGDNGILTRAKDSKIQTEIGEEKEKISVAFSGLKIGKQTKNDDSPIKAQELQNEINGITVSGEGDLIVKYNDSGRSYIVKQDGTIIEGVSGDEVPVEWTQTENGITNGELETPIKIGDTIDYNAGSVDEEITLNQDKTGYSSSQLIKLNQGSALTWIVIGVESGKLLIAPTSNVTKSGVCLQGIIGYEKGITTLNEISEKYGKGKGAESARSITVEDINKITGYDPEKEECISSSPYYELNVYGTDVTYYWEGSNVKCSCKTDNLREIPPLNQHSSKLFYWFDVKAGKCVKNPCPDGGEKKNITTLKNNYYSYSTSGNSLYEELFNNGLYWLASRCWYMNCDIGYLSFDYRLVDRNGRVTDARFFNSNGEVTNESGPTFGVRPRVILKTNVVLEKKGENSWHILN